MKFLEVGFCLLAAAMLSCEHEATELPVQDETTTVQVFSDEIRGALGTYHTCSNEEQVARLTDPNAIAFYDFSPRWIDLYERRQLASVLLMVKLDEMGIDVSYGECPAMSELATRWDSVMAVN